MTAAVLPAAARADEAPAGPVASRYAIADLTVPLPEGDWQVIANAEQPLHGDFPTDRIHAAALIQLSGNAVAALVLVQAATGGDGAWGVPSNCRRSDLYEARVLTSPSSLLAVCDYVAPVIQDVGPGSSVAWSTAGRMAGDRGWSLPTTWLVVGMRVADDGDVLDVRYYFNPDVLALPLPEAGAPAGAGEGWWARLCAITGRGYRWAVGGVAGDPRWAASGWSPAAVAADPRRRAVTADLIAWTGPALRAVRAGFANRPLPQLMMPAPWARDPTPRRTPPLIGAGRDSWPGLALWKTVSWRIVGSSLDMLVSFSVTGSATAAGAITFIGAAVNSVGYYLHEVAWNDYQGEELVTDLPAGGIDR